MTQRKYGIKSEPEFKLIKLKLGSSSNLEDDLEWLDEAIIEIRKFLEEREEKEEFSSQN